MDIADKEELSELSNRWLYQALKCDYVNHFSILGRPIIQIPQDIYIVQELIWNVRPDLVIETGIAHGGSIINSAMMLVLLDYCDTVKQKNLEKGEKRLLYPMQSKRKVIGIDIDIRQHNRKAIESHPLNNLIQMIEGSSTDHNIINQVKNIAKDYNKIMVFLDSNHTHDHVLSELKAYSPLISIGSYIVVWDTGIEDLPDCSHLSGDRPWGKGNNPKTAVHEFLNSDEGKCFEIDKTIAEKLAITSAHDGFLKRMT